MTETTPRRFRFAWWHCAVLAVVVLLVASGAAAAGWRALGRSQYLTVVERLRAAGRPASVDEYVATAPVVDRALQEDWSAWQKRMSGAPFANYAGDLQVQQGHWDAWVTAHGPRPVAVEAILARMAPAMADALPMLQHRDLVVSGFGWIAQDLPPGKRMMPFTSGLRLANLLAVRELATWLGYEAVLADDPRQRLGELDALVASLRRPASLIDAMLTIAVAGMRDRTYVELALRGTLPAERRQAWLVEPARALGLVADGMEGESVLTGHGTAAMLGASASPFSFRLEAPGWSGAWSGLVIWTTGYRDCATIIEVQSHLAQRLRGERVDAWETWDQIKGRLGPFGRIICPNLTECAISGLQADAGHRSARLAVRVIALARQGSLPVDQAALVSALEDPQVLVPPGGDALRLRYEVPAPGRFRLVIDPTSPIPNFDDAKRQVWRSASAGTPPANEPVMWSRQGILIELAMGPDP